MMMPHPLRLDLTKRYSVFNHSSTALNTKPRRTVLLLGATGYLGQFVQLALGSVPSILLINKGGSRDLDFTKPWDDDNLGKDDIVVDVVVNCAAVSQPGECAKDPERARLVNVPRGLVEWIARRKNNKPLLIHLSTDHVYEGTRSFYKETDEVNPVNHYGATKVEAERLIRSLYPCRHVILRSSIIIGPQAPITPVNRPLLLQFIQTALASGKPTSFFDDEWRCPVSVHDVVDVITACTLRAEEFEHAGETFNLGGPERLSRADMAEIVSDLCGLDRSLIQRVSALTVNRGVKSPTDISMDSSKIEGFLGRRLTSFKETARRCLSERIGT